MKYLTIKFFCILSLSLLAFNSANAQKYMTKTGHAYFMSHTDAIDIDGNNYQVAAIADTETGELVVIVLIKAFEFTLATADKHFNETYMESDEFPKAIFKGSVPELKAIDLSKNGTYDASAKGNLTIHGESNPVEKTGTLEIKDGNILINCDFNVLIDDYKIKVPKSVEDRVAKEVDVKIDLSLSPR
ncbi:MAG: YceI family protein [Bacteroidales bacterium]|nr:YceI family protein [Bacteroidales bacterium]MBN2820945.1 YceI family protein [Bacteroidales bacterium]